MRNRTLVSYIWHENQEVYQTTATQLPKHDVDDVLKLNGSSWRVVDIVHNIHFRELVYYVEPYEEDEL